MLQPLSTGFAGKEESTSFFGHMAEGNFFCVLEVFDGYTKEQGEAFLHSLAEQVAGRNPTALKDFEEEINSFMKQADIPVDFSLAAGYCTQSVFYLKSIGSGQIYIKRGSHFEQLIEGDKSASGYIENKDTFVFTTEYFMEASKGKDFVKKKVSGHAVSEDMVKSGGVLFVSFIYKPEPVAEAVGESPRFQPPPTQEKAPSPVKLLIQRLLLQMKQSTKKKIALGITLVLLIALLLNVGNLFGKKQQVIRETKVGSVKEQIENDLNAIDEEDIENALGVVSTARARLKELKAKDKKISSTDIKQLEDLIAKKESGILKREEKNATEFFDLAVEEKGGRADRMYLDGDNAALLNRQGKIYLLSLTNKSVEKKVFGEIANAQLIASYENSLFFFRQGAGIYKIAGDKPKRIIENDSQWGNVVDMNIYNGNIYLLDKKNDEIYKYLVAENGYSDKSSYIKSGKMSLTGANSLSIDSAIYIGFNDSIVKYLSGEKQDFTAQFPTTDVSLVKTFTNKDMEQIYALDKSEGILYIFTKEGAYVRQIKSPSLKQTDDFAVYKGNVYLLNKTKVLQIEL